jgi:hypothetical protein
MSSGKCCLCGKTNLAGHLTKVSPTTLGTRKLMLEIKYKKWKRTACSGCVHKNEKLLQVCSFCGISERERERERERASEVNGVYLS